MITDFLQVNIDEKKFENEYIKQLEQKIKEQQKEIEELKGKNKTLESLLQGNLYEMYLYYKELAGKYQANSISKDKIKAKIEEYNKMINATYEDLTHYGDYRRDVCFEIKNVLQALLEE